MMSSFVTFIINILYIACLTITKSYTDIRLVLLEIEGGQIDPPSGRTTFKKTSLTEVMSCSFLQRLAILL